MSKLRTYEDEIRELLAEARAANDRYDSAQYDRRSGLNGRIEAIEEAVVRLARAIDGSRAV